MSIFPYHGYAGRYLRVDLTAGHIEELDLPVQWAEMYLGGNGIGTKILWDEVPAWVNPLQPENALILATGPLCGSPMPNSGRVEWIGKSPLSGIYGDANAGGHFGPELKAAGYDLVIFTGRAAEPVILWICDETVELRPAGKLWGLTVKESEQRLQDETGDPDIKTALIGPAGENLVRYASIQVSYRRSAARSGLGAVMGSKKLKGVAVRARGGIRMANPEGIQNLSFRLQQRLRKNEFYQGVHTFGTPGLVAMVQPMGRFPTRNFQYGSFEGFDEISGETLREGYLERDIACFNCPIGCDKVYEVTSGEFAGTRLSSVEYETLNSLGARLGNHCLPALLKGNELCDDWGLDTISAGSAVAFAFELAEKGILPPEEWEGVHLEWGNYSSILELLRRIAYREGRLGDLLAEGAARAARWLGRGAERYAMHVKGLDIPAQDGRAQQSMGLAHVTSSRGADHLKAFPVIDETGYPSEAVKRYGERYLPDLIDPLATRYKAMLVKDGEEFAAVVDSCGNCKSGGTFVMAEVYWTEQAEALRFATGMDLDASRIQLIGERIVNLQRCYNALHGLTSADDVLPWRFTQVPSPSGNALGSVCKLDEMLQEYYRMRGWDTTCGMPEEITLRRLGLEAAWLRIDESFSSGTAQAHRQQLGWAEPYTGAVSPAEIQQG